jgi:amino acid transporter
VLGTTSRRTGSPKIGSIIQTVIGVVVILTYALAGWDPLVTLFYWGGTTGGLGVLLLIGATSIAVIVFFARHPSGESRWRRVIAPVSAAIAMVIVIGLALANFATLLGVQDSSPLRWGIPGAYLIIALLGVAWGLRLRSARPQIYRTMGLGATGVGALTGLGAVAPDQHADGTSLGQVTRP